MDEFERQQQAYERGETAYAAGKLRDTNPEADELLRDAWFAGWDRAREVDDNERG
ncbi:ribosome modulation factor [Paraburkholderia sp. GAS32]|uniref:ribosome modulation factor n=1 Tax=Paraburkholderia sp. GAS32 TaxID=3035129 RepID=UPI003D235B58